MHGHAPISRPAIRPSHRARRTIGLRAFGTSVIAALVAVVLVVLPTQSASAADSLTQPFTTTTATGWSLSGSACLTKIATGTGSCATRNDAPAQTLADGFLQLNDNRGGLAGSALYTSPITAANGLDVKFDQFQVGTSVLNANGEGIGFHLTDGSAVPTIGAGGSSLGYVKNSSTNGITNGYLGIGLDVAGGFSTASGRTSAACSGSAGAAGSAGTATAQPNRIVARGPGNAASGYCYLGAATADLRMSSGVLLPGLGTFNPSDPPAAAGRTIRVTVGTGATPQVTVYYGASAGMAASALTQVLSFAMTTAAPSSYHLGFTGTTSAIGGLLGLGPIMDTHLIRSLVVKPLNSLTVSAAINTATTQPASYAQGVTVPYLYTVTNTGGASVSAVSVTDTRGTTISCPTTTLAAGASTVCSGNNAVTAAEAIAATTLSTTATATATSTTGSLSATSNVVTVPISAPVRTLSLSKVGALVENAPANGKADAGEKITYTFTATNTGNVTASGVVVADPKVSGITPGTATIAPGASQVFTSTPYTVTAADINANVPITNTATVTATGFTSATSTVNTPVNYAPALALTKSGTLNGTSAVGSTISYAFTLTNTGNTPLTSVGITDPLATATITWPAGYTVGTLASGQSVNATATYTVTQAAIDAGQVLNTATGRGTPSSGAQVTSVASTTTTLARTPGLTFTKAASPSFVRAAGAVVTYTFTATNTGNTTLGSVAITDNHAGLSTISYSWPGTPGSLAPAAVLTATASYTTTTADAAAGTVNNTASIAATPAGGTPITRTASAAVAVVPDPIADAASVAQGDAVVINVLANDGTAAAGSAFSRAQLSSTPAAIGGASVPAPATPLYGSVTCVDSGVTRGACTYRSVDFFTGTDVFDYALSGPYGSWNVRVTVTVTVKNHAPIARPDRLVATTNGARVDFDPRTNDSDPDAGDTLTITASAAPGGLHGSFSCTATGCSFTPAGDGWTGSASIPYTVTDTGGLTSSSTIEVFVDPAPLTMTGFTDTKANSAAVGIGTWTSSTTVTSPAGTCIDNRPRTALSWPTAAGATSYVLERRLAGSGSWVTVALLGSAATSFVDDRLGEGRSYEWRVRPDLERWPGTVSSPSSASSQVAVATAKGC